nr:EAL domain-containing protein [Glaciecola sp. MH2013]
MQGYDENRNVIYWNKGSELLYGYSEEEALGCKLESLIIPTDMHDSVVAAHRNWVDNNIPIGASKLTLRAKNNLPVNVYSSHVMFTTELNKKQMYCIDISLDDVLKAKQQISIKENLLEAVLDATPDLFFVMEEDTTIISFHTNSQDDLYVVPDGFIGKPMASILPKEVSDKLKTNIKKALQQDGVVDFQYQLNVPAGLLYFEARARHLKTEKQLVLVVRDITEQHNAAETIKRQAYFDTLTKLPNRFLSLDRLSQIMNEAERQRTQCAVLFLDLDDFKKVNDSLGHDTGDQVLVESATRLTTVIRKRDTVGRLGGDEFIVLLPDVADYRGITTVVENLLDAFRQPFKLEGRELMLTLSVGVAIYPENGDNASDLLRNADTAMYQAKAMGRNAYSFFTKEMDEITSRRFELEDQMRGALQRGEFSLHFQPKLHAQTAEIVGAEALLRWFNPVLGNVGPDEFIPIAEHTGLIIEIGEFVITQALSFLSSWEAESQKNLHVAVNLSPRQFRDKNLLNFVSDAMLTANIPPHKLEFEITEGVLLTGENYITETLNNLHNMGVTLSMDDFGTGYSSLSYLRQYSFNMLKIDRSFVSGIVENTADQKLVIATIAMAHSLGLKVVAEGVETEAQYALLNKLGCDFVQGYYFSKPLPQEDLLASS